MNILREKQKLLPMGNYMGGGGSTDSGGSKTQTQITELPEWAKPYAKETLAKASALTDTSQNPYQTYDQPRIAGFAPMQQQAMQGAQTMAPSEQVGFGSNLAGIAGLGALNTQYNPMMARSRDFNTYAANQYMNPYMQNVVDIQQREAQRQADIAGTQRQAQATQAGAFGGSRDAIMRAEAARNLALQKGDIQAQGLNQAFQQAQAQFNADQARRLQAQQLTEQSRQYGAGLGMQGLQTGLQAAGQLGNLGAQQFQQAMDINKLQSAYGGMQQAQQQQGLDLAYQDFQNQQNYPYKQLGFMSDILRGTPTGSSTTTYMYGQPGSTLGQIAGLGTGIYGLSKFMAEGGEVKGYADGGEIESIVSKLSDQQLVESLQAAQARGDIDQADIIQKELAMRRSERGGVAGAFNMLPQDVQQNMIEQKAGGGVVALAGGDIVGDMSAADEYFSQEPKYQEGEWKKIFKQNVREGETYTPGILGTLFGYNTLPAKEAASVPATKATAAENAQYNPATATRRKDYEDAAPMKAPAAPAKAAPAAIKAISAAAESKGLTSDDLLAEAKKAENYFNSKHSKDLEGLQALIDKQSGRSKEIKERGLAEALMQFGFTMAAKAAEPGKPGEDKRGLRGLLSSAAAASPVLGQVAAENQKLQQAADDNAAKLQIEYSKYKVALNKGDTQAAMTFATNVRTLTQQQQQLELKRQELAQQGAYQQGLLGIHGQTAQNQARKLGILEKQAEIQAYAAQTRLGQLAINAGKQFDESRGARDLMNQLKTQYGATDPRIAGVYKQARDKHIRETLMMDRGTAERPTGVRNVADLLSED